MTIVLAEVEKTVRAHYGKAKESISFMKKAFSEAAPISDVVPGYEAKTLAFGAYAQDNFTVLFIDIRRSTERAKILGPERTFLSLHAFFPAVAYVIEKYGGYVLDFMGDGVMAFFGGNQSNMARNYAMQQAGLCGLALQKVINEVVNSILREDGIKFNINCCVGIDHGQVIVTKIGTDAFYDVKAIGDCINKASKLSGGEAGTVVVSRTVRESWPKGKKGKVSFKQIKIKNNHDGFTIEKS